MTQRTISAYQKRETYEQLLAAIQQGKESPRSATRGPACRIDAVPVKMASSRDAIIE